MLSQAWEAEGTTRAGFYDFYDSGGNRPGRLAVKTGEGGERVGAPFAHILHEGKWALRKEKERERERTRQRGVIPFVDSSVWDMGGRVRLYCVPFAFLTWGTEAICGDSSVSSYLDPHPTHASS